MDMKKKSPELEGLMKALSGIRSDAKHAQLGDGLPGNARGEKFMISIGFGPPPAALEMAEEEDEDDGKKKRAAFDLEDE